MPTSAAGSSARRRRARACGGFTLLEILAAVFIMALLTSLAALALPGGNDELARTEAQRLAALFDTAREQAAALSMPVAWAAGPDGYEFLRPSPRGWVPLVQAPLSPRSWGWLDGTPPARPPAASPSTWYAGNVRIRVVGGGGALGAPPGWLVFGAEPVSQPMLVELETGDLRLSVASNGAQPFEVRERR
jgi:general secretion pathway protein H